MGDVLGGGCPAGPRFASSFLLSALLPLYLLYTKLLFVLGGGRGSSAMLRTDLPAILLIDVSVLFAFGKNTWSCHLSRSGLGLYSSPLPFDHRH